MGRSRKRSVSGGSFRDMNSFSEGDECGVSREEKLEATHKLFRSLLQHQVGSKSCLLHFEHNPAIMIALLDRAQQLDEMKDSSIRKQLLLLADAESGYTPLHWAIFRGDLALVLFLMRHALSNPSPRLTHRPMAMIENTVNASVLVQEMVVARDHEGFTPHDLLLHRQRLELLGCRLSLPRPRVQKQAGRSHRTSFDLADDEGDEQNEFDLLSRSLMHMQRMRNKEILVKGVTSEYGCEVLTFGKAHHCALGVGNTPDVSSPQVRPQRVQAFGQSQTGRLGGAVAIAAAAHHTLVATANGEVFAFGLGKGGRLGLGDQITHCPTPSRITGGSLSHRKVVGISAAENHSLAVTACGYVFAWGSNRFGQLSDDGPSRSVPRRVEDLKNSFCVAVAAGAKHSVALTRQGEVYVWGDNTAGQLGISRRSGTHKVQRVESLWNASVPKLAIAVEASEQATLVLTIPSGNGLPVNTIYSWGHGSHVPSRVVFEQSTSGRLVNPVAIACARYHNVAVSSDGLVYTWGLHAEPLGVLRSPKKTSNSSMITSPQLVKGMLPENGGGFAVAVSASENHTAVLTDTGSMFTWGATNGKNVMGHAEIRWQPDPKRVPGVSRAVAVAAAKEHTVFLMGASFPALPPLPELNEGVHSLEEFAARKIADFIDLFNAIPLLMVAERTDSTSLIEYCTEFCRRNLDGILTVAQRSVLDGYLNEQLRSCPIAADQSGRDQTYHPILEDIVLAGSERGPLGTVHALCDREDWIMACEKLSRSDTLRIFFHSIDKRQGPPSVAQQRARSESNAGSKVQRERGVSDRCRELTTKMDLSTEELASQKLILLSKELRATKKRLVQISKLLESQGSSLSAEQQEKVARRSQLEADLNILEPALEKVEKMMGRLVQQKLSEENLPREEAKEEVRESDNVENKCLRCDVCGISCPDDGSYALHMSGRKHRNKLAQVRYQEEAEVAAAMMMEQTKQKLIKSETSPPVVASDTAWKKLAKSITPIPYKLPPPPHGTPDSLAASPKAGAQIDTKPTLKEIMEEESRKCSLTKGTVLAKKGPAKPAAKVKQTLSSPLVLPVGIAPPLISPPWASPRAKKAPNTVLFPSPDIPVMSKSLSQFSLADYVKTPTPRTPLSTSPTLGKAWHRAVVVANDARESCTPSKNTAVRFADIQQQEMASKEIAAQVFHTPSETNKWYMERRERTGSLLDIQTEASQQRDNEVLIEEQFRIEKMIAEENERRAKEGAQLCKAKSRKKKHSNDKKKRLGPHSGKTGQPNKSKEDVAV